MMRMKLFSAPLLTRKCSSFLLLPDSICNLTRSFGESSTFGAMIQTVKKEDDNYIIQTKEPKSQSRLCYSIRPATIYDVPKLKEIRQSMGIHDVPTVFETFMQIDPQGYKIAVDDTGEIIGTCSCVFNGDDSHGLFFGGTYCVDPELQGYGIGLKLYREGELHYGETNCGMNSVPSMLKIYKEKGGFPLEEKDWVCIKNQTPNDVSPEALSNIVPPGVDIQPFQNSFLPQMIAYDHALVGFRRSLMLSMSCNEENSKTFVAFKKGMCVGFGSIKESCLGAGRVGPLYADDPAVAEVILRKLIESFPNRKGFAMNTLSNNIHANSMLRKLDCPAKDQCHRLYTQQKLIVDNSKIYALFDLNFVVY